MCWRSSCPALLLGLVPGLVHGQSPYTHLTLPSGVLVFDGVSASQAKAWFQSTSPSMAPLPLRSLAATTALPAGVDPSQGDSDDPTPPVLIVTQSPAIPGVTVPR